MCWEDNLDLLEATLEPIGVIYLYSGVFLGAWLMLGPFRLIFSTLGYLWPSRGVSRDCLGLSGAFLGHVELSRDQERFTNPLSKLLCPLSKK